MVWLWIILGVIGLAGFGHFLSIAASRKADRIMKGMERQYEGFIEVLFANVYLKDKNWEEYNQEEIVHQCLKVLKPHLESLLAYINATDNSDVAINFPTKYFANVASLAGSLFYKRNKHKDHPITKEDEEKMYAALRDALEADITKRHLYLQSGRL